MLLQFLSGLGSFLQYYSLTLVSVCRGTNLPVIGLMECFCTLWRWLCVKGSPSKAWRGSSAAHGQGQAGVQCSRTPLPPSCLAFCTGDVFAVYLLWQCPRPVRRGNAVCVCAGRAKRCLLSVDGELGGRRELRTGGGRQGKVPLPQQGTRPRGCGRGPSSTCRSLQQSRALHFWIWGPDLCLYHGWESCQLQTCHTHKPGLGSTD